MNALLDTHVFLWAAAEPERLSSAARETIADPSNQIFVSAAVVWEIVIKHSLGKLTLPSDPPSYITTRLELLKFQGLPISHLHALSVGGLPHYHADPFDRIMIAQAQRENITFITADETILRYPIATLDARL